MIRYSIFTGAQTLTEAQLNLGLGSRFDVGTGYKEPVLKYQNRSKTGYPEPFSEY